jgi:hypothetical protein
MMKRYSSLFLLYKNSERCMNDDLRDYTRWIYVAMAVLLWLTITPAAAEVYLQRFALVLSNNDGGRERIMLRYADTDARNFANVLQEMGGLQPNNLVLITHADRQAVDSAFTVLEKKLTTAQSMPSMSKLPAPKPKGRTEVVVYYSGHADGVGLLLGGKHYEYSKLRKRLEGLQADVKIAVLDACESGAFIRAKGGRIAQPFLLDESSNMNGYAVLTSSSRNEVSQESDRIGGSYFTHSLLTGMRGAADVNGDGKVTLGESYQFAFHETLARTTHAEGGGQHPNYEMNLSGTGDVVMTDLSQTSAVLVLDRELSGRFYVRDPNGFLIAELNKPVGRKVDIGLEPGRYSVEKEDKALYVTEFFIAQGERFELKNTSFAGAYREISLARGGTHVQSGKRIHKDTSGLNSAQGSFCGEGGSQFAYGNGFKSTVGNDYCGTQLSLFHNKAGKNFKGFSAALVSNKMDGPLLGLQWALFSNRNFLNVRGLQWSGIYGRTDGWIEGVQWAGLIGLNNGLTGVQWSGLLSHIEDGRVTGVQWGGLASTATQLSDFYGAQFGGLMAYTEGNAKGVQFSGIYSHTTGNRKGAQFGGVVAIAQDFKGLQVAGVSNHAQNLQGLQIAGLINNADSVWGAQIGVINVARHMEGFSLGLINLYGNGIIAVGWSVQDHGIPSVTFRSGLKTLHSHLAVYHSQMLRNIHTPGLHKNAGQNDVVGFGSGLATQIRKENFHVQLEQENAWFWNELEDWKHWDSDRLGINFLSQFKLGIGYRYAGFVALSIGATANFLLVTNEQQVLLKPAEEAWNSWLDTIRDPQDNWQNVTAYFWPGIYAKMEMGRF